MLLYRASDGLLTASKVGPGSRVTEAQLFLKKKRTGKAQLMLMHSASVGTYPNYHPKLVFPAFQGFLKDLYTTFSMHRDA